MQCLPVIRQGDAYSIPIYIQYGDETITEDNAVGVRVAIGKFVQEWPNGELIYSDNYWYFNLTQKMSYSMRTDFIPYQVQYSPDGEHVFTSPVVEIKIDKSILPGEWSVSS